MEFLQAVNVVANSFICIGMSLFFLLLYGNEHSVVQKWPVLQHWSLKLSLISIVTTSAWNALHTVYTVIVPRGPDYTIPVSTPVGEILLNVGLAALFCWVVYFHKFHFLKVAPPKTTRAKTKKRIVKK